MRLLVIYGVQPDALNRARELERLGEDEAATRAYLTYLGEAPDDLQALTDLGNLAMRRGYTSAARTAYLRVAQLDPRNLVARVNLGNVLLRANDLPAAREQYEAALSIDPVFAPAHQGLSYVYARLGDEEASQRHRDLGFAGHALLRIPFRGPAQPVRALVMVSAAGGDFNTDWLLDQHRFDVTKIFAEYADPGIPLPEFDVLVNAIGDADRCQHALHCAERIAERAKRDAINPPHRVRETKRVDVSRRLRAISQLVVPHVANVHRAALPQARLTFPLLLRTPGHHTGRHFLMVESEATLPQALASLPGDELLVIDYFDLHGADGYVRKYRVLAIDGRLYPVHAAISRDWKVHYFTADMAASEAHRAEDAQFLAHPQRVIGTQAWKALEEIVHALQLDYVGIDFGIDAAGRPVIFEANAAMSMYPTDPEPMWDYRRTAMDRIRDAFHGML